MPLEHAEACDKTGMRSLNSRVELVKELACDPCNCSVQPGESPDGVDAGDKTETATSDGLFAAREPSDHPPGALKFVKYASTSSVHLLERLFSLRHLLSEVADSPPTVLPLEETAHGGRPLRISEMSDPRRSIISKASLNELYRCGRRHRERSNNQSKGQLSGPMHGHPRRRPVVYGARVITHADTKFCSPVFEDRSWID